MQRLLLLTSLVFLLAPCSAHATQCPVDSIALCGIVTTSTAPSYALSGCTLNTAGGTYDLIAGNLTAGAGLNSEVAIVATDDVYTIVGPASPTPVSITAHFTVKPYVSNWASSLYAEIRSGTAMDGEFLRSTSTLSIPLAPIVGQPFHIHLKLQATAVRANTNSNSSSGHGTLSFVLADGYGVFSCQGYSTGLPTGAQTNGWGRIRVIYR